jgi:phospholipid/cholesterol/gamma-HCH transport system substrate-binding protein
MEENNQRFSVGVLVLAAGIIGVLLVAYFGAVPAFWVERYRITVNFRSAPKVTIDTPVRKNGVLIGRVSNVVLGPGDAGVNVTMELEKKYEIQKSEMPLITSESLITGDAVIQFVPPSPQSLLDRFDGTVGTPRDGIMDEPERKAMTDIITEGYYSKGGEVAKDPMEALASIGPAFQRIDQLVLTIQDAIGGDSGPVRDLSATARTTLNNFNETVSSANRILSQVEEARIPEAVSRGLNLLPEVLKSAQDTLVQTQKTLKGFETFSSSLEGIGTEFEGIGVDVRQAVQNANTAIANIADITEPVKESSDVIVERAVRLMGNLDALAIDLKQFSTRLNSSSGTIAQLIDNPQLYHQTTETIGSIRAASANVQAITARLQPIVDDVRIFTDKIARDPGQIGVRGALSGRTLGTGLK